jgi:HD-GYP domain-containing protein (c-di-GMP phosphodiesterase class II)
MSGTLPSPSLRGITPLRLQRGAAGINQRVADRLLADGRIRGDQHRDVIELATSRKARVEEAILELDVLAEAELLRYVATLNKTRFVSTEKLSMASIGARVLDMVSTKTAECHGVFPVLFDDRTATLSLVTADPDDERALHEVKMAKPMIREIEVLVARPAAVRAAISFHYRGDRAAFRALLPVASALEAEGRIPSFALDDRRSSTTPTPPASAQRRAAPVTPPPPRRSSAPPVPRIPPPPALPSSQPEAHASCAPSASPHFIETLRTLVTFFEQRRGDLGGHAAAVARLVRQVCERMGLDHDHTAALVVAAYVHDLGKEDHLTALDVARDDGHRAAAQGSAGLPAQIMASLDLLPETVAAIGAMYERWDGLGLPFGHAGKDIPLGARILAAADTYADLTQNPGNRYRRMLRPFEACAVLLKYGGGVFDPEIVDVIRRVIIGAEPRAEMFEELPAVLRG